MTRPELIDHCLTFPAAYEDYPFDDAADVGAWTVICFSNIVVYRCATITKLSL